MSSERPGFRADWLDEVVVGSVVALLDGYEVVAFDDPKIDGPAIAAVIGFTGVHIQGCAGLVARQDTLVATAPNVGPDDLDAADWAGELLNRAAGLLKSRLLRDGLVVRMAPPVHLRAVSITLHPGANVRTYLLRGAAGMIKFWVDFSHVESAPLAEPEEDEVLDAGDCMMF